MKKSNLLLIVAVLLGLLPVSALFAQDQQTPNHNNLKLAFEFGANEMDCELIKPEQIRENRSAGYSNNLGNSLSTTYFGVKPEYFLMNNRLGIASGLRLTIASSKLVSDRDDFLWRAREEGLTTDYVRIDGINHKSYLLGIPIEVRIFPNKREAPFQHYFKIGASANFLIHTENEVNFTNKAMKKYDGLVQNQLSENGNAISAFFFGAIGFKIGKYQEGRWAPWGNIEFHLPYLLLTEKSITFAGKSDFFNFPGVGFQCSFEVPIGKNVPIGSNSITNH